MASKDVQYVVQENGFWYVAGKEKTKTPEITVSSKGVANGLSEEYNDGWDFGPDSYNPSVTSGVPLTQTSGIQEAKEALPKVTNFASGRLVPNGTIVLIFHNTPMYITTPIQIYDDEFVSLISYDGYTQPIQPENKPVVYIENTASTGDVIDILVNPTVSSTAGNNLGNGIITIDGISLQSTTGSGRILFNTPIMVGGKTRPNPSQVIIGKLGLYDSTGVNNLLLLVSSGNDDGCYIDHLFAVGATNNNGLLISISYNHFLAKKIFILSTGAASAISNPATGWMISCPQGSITSLDLFSYGFNGGLITMPTNGTTGSEGLFITYLHDELNTPGTGWVGGKDTNDNYGTTSLRGNVTVGVVEDVGGLFYSPYVYSGVAFKVLGEWNTPVSGITKVFNKDLEILMNDLTLPANPPVSGTVYQSPCGIGIKVTIPVYATVAGTAGTVAIYSGRSSTPPLIGTKYISGSTSSTSTDFIELFLPVGQYYELVLTGVTLGTATVFAD